jgi:hypothetical protein
MYGSVFEGFFKLFYFLLYVAPFLCVGLGLLIGWLIWA